MRFSALEKAWLLGVVALACGRTTDEAPNASATQDGSIERDAAAEIDERPPEIQRELDRCTSVREVRSIRVRPQGARPLSAQEYERTVSRLVGAPAPMVALEGGPSWWRVSDGWPSETTDDAHVLAAETSAALAGSRHDALLDCRPDEPDRDCMRRFIETFGFRAFRSPVTPEEIERLLGAYDATLAQKDASEAFEEVVRTIFASPHFFLLTAIGIAPSHEDSSTVRALTPFELASRLSYWLWGEPPDDELLGLARSGEITRPPVLVEQAGRMLADSRATVGLEQMNAAWLSLDDLTAIDSNALLDPALLRSMREETLRFLKHSIRDGDARIETVLTTPTTFADARLASIYGQTAPVQDFDLIDLPPEERSGLLTQASLLTVATMGNTNAAPTRRGYYLQRVLRCFDVPWVNEHDFDARELDTSRPARTRYRDAFGRWAAALGRDPAVCAACHQFMDELGFALERYDGVGRYHEADPTGPIDDLGTFVAAADAGPVSFAFRGARGLAQLLQSDPEVFRCVAKSWLAQAAGPLDNAWSAEQAARPNCAAGNLRELLLALVATDAFRFVRSDPNLSPAEPSSASCSWGGLTDCRALADLRIVDAALCDRCQGRTCGEDPACSQFSCAGVVVVRGCCSDGDCEGLGVCGRYTAPHGVCTPHDAI